MPSDPKNSHKAGHHGSDSGLFQNPDIFHTSHGQDALGQGKGSSALVVPALGMKENA
jgi:hypothetical protein